jgi:predicted esterase
MTTAWYTPTAFSPIPVGSSSSAKSSEGEEEKADEAEDEILASVEYICGLIDEEAKKGIPLERIVIGGFSQGCAISLVVALGSRYKGQLGGVVGLSGYLPSGGKLSAAYREFRKDIEGEKMKIFLAHGTKDMLIPMRIFRAGKKRVQSIVGDAAVETKEYEGWDMLRVELSYGICVYFWRELCQLNAERDAQYEDKK